jgi:hypothetical protein
MLTDAYKRLVNMLRGNNGLAPLYPAPGVASSPAAAEHVDISDRDGDGFGEGEARDAAELVRRSYRQANGDDEGVDVGGDDEEDEFSSLGAMALPVRRMLTAHFQSKFENADLERETAAAEVERVQAAADFIRKHASAGVIRK